MEKQKTNFSAEEETKILQLAKKRFDRSVDAFSKTYEKAITILEFKYGKQWTDDQKNKRKEAERPALTINEMSKFSNLVCGEMRRNKVQIKLTPMDSKASRANAEVKAGLIKNIEYESNAEITYDHAGKMLVDCGFAAGRVLNRYVRNPDEPFLQELYIAPIDNPFSVHPDPGASDSRFYSDGEYFFIDSPMSKEDFIDSYGDEFLPDANQDNPKGTEKERWYDDQKVMVREYYYKEYTVKKMVQLSDGQIKEKSEAEAFIEQSRQTLMEAKADQDMMRQEALEAGDEFNEQPIEESDIPEIVKERDVEVPHIKWLKITSRHILESNEWKGELIPVAFSTGEYSNISGERFYDGLFKDAVDPQRLINNAYSSLWETVALMPKAPWQASAKMIEGFEDDYLAANAENFPVLKYKFDSDFPGQKPTQNFIGQMPAAMYQILQETKQNLKDAVGMYNADVGDQGPEVSGKAILARQAPGDTSTYVYHDNRSGFVAQIGKILNDAIPHYYDTERDVRLRGFNEKDSTVPINTTVGNTVKNMMNAPDKYTGIDKKALNRAGATGPGTSFNNVTEGKYDVVVMTGPAYETQRQEAAENIMNIAKIAGSLHPADLYHLVDTLDFPGVDEWKATIKKRVPPGILPEEEDDEPPKPQPPTPEDKLNMAKLEVQLQKSKNEQIDMYTKILELQKELAQTKGEINKAIIDKLDELMAPVHPADMNPDMQPQMPEGEGGQL